MGESVFGKVFVHCHRRSSLAATDMHITCINGTWTPPIPDCMCSPLHSTALSTTCTINGFETSCLELALPGTEATVKCPAEYIYSKQTLRCLSNGKWKLSGPPLQCRHQCGVLDLSKDLRWDVYIHGENYHLLCYGVILNSVYILTNSSCIANETDHRLGTWHGPNNYRFQAIERGMRYALLRLKNPLRFDFDHLKMPICLDNTQGNYESSFIWRANTLAGCHKEVYAADESTYVSAQCPNNNTECVYSFGAAYHHASRDRIDGYYRRYLFALGLPPRRLGANQEDGYYDCDTSLRENFTENDYLEIDFIDDNSGIRNNE